jgi:hypothetical protein
MTSPLGRRFFVNGITQIEVSFRTTAGNAVLKFLSCSVGAKQFFEMRLERRFWNRRRAPAYTLACSAVFDAPFLTFLARHPMRPLPAPLFSLGKGMGCLLVLLVATVAGGCLTATSTERSPRPTLLNPRWEDEAFADHLEFFRDAAQDSTPPDAKPVADYVSAAMRRAWLQPGVEGRYRLWRAPGPPQGYVGYAAGKNPLTVEDGAPPVAQQAVIVCADLTGAEAAPEAAALLEVARVYGIASQYTLMPERSVIFALWPRGPAQDDPLAGLRAFLRTPTWRLENVRALLYVGLPPRLGPETQQLLEDHEIPLIRVSDQQAEVAGATADESSEREAAVARARRLAERTHRRLRAATLTSGKMMPALGDTLRVPPSERP